MARHICYGHNIHNFTDSILFHRIYSHYCRRYNIFSHNVSRDEDCQRNRGYGEKPTQCHR